MKLSLDRMASTDARACAALPAGSYEVLRALVLGLDLRETAEGWAFVGPWQTPERSGVSADIATALHKNGFVARGKNGVIEISEFGRHELERSTTSIIDSVTKWLRSTRVTDGALSR